MDPEEDRFRFVDEEDRPDLPDEGEVVLSFSGGTMRSSGPGARKALETVIASIERQKEQRARWPKDLREAMTVLCKKFPTLANAGGVDPWDTDRFIAWLNGPAPGSGANAAGRFVLGVWNSETDWTECGLRPPGKFDLFRFMGTCDEEHRRALFEWLDAPFWP